MAATEDTPLHNKNAVKTDERDSADSTETQSTFSSKYALIFTCLGSAVGTGNIWRYPRLLAANSGDEGALCFVLVWLAFLALWSVPMLLVEYSLGRYTRKGVIVSFQQLTAGRITWCGVWITVVNFAIGCYYTVILGWCMFYAYHAIVYPLPLTYQQSADVFFNFTGGAPWPVLTQVIAILCTGAILINGVKTIERANMFLTPSLLLLIFVFFAWAVSRPYAGRGLAFLFTPDWKTLLDPLLWVEAASQNAYDTGAGTGIFVAYAAFMSNHHHIVKYSVLIPVTNNFISLCCGMLTFATVFSAVNLETPNATDTEVLAILKQSGPGSTGLAFIWLPQLLSTAGTAGRVMCAVFFVCLVFGALSSNIATMEMITNAFTNFGLRRVVAVCVTMVLFFVLGLGSALSLKFLTNQDFTWGVALLVNGLLLQVLVIMFGAESYRDHIVNECCDKSDWRAPYVWTLIIKWVAPVEAVGLLVWWCIDVIIHDDPTQPWYRPGTTSLVSVLIQWLTVLGILLLGNLLLCKFKPFWFTRLLDVSGAQKLDGMDDLASLGTDNHAATQAATEKTETELTR